MISEGFVRADREVQIMPKEALVVGSNDEIVTARVDIEGRDPASARLDDLEQFLLGKII